MRTSKEAPNRAWKKPDNGNLRKRSMIGMQRDGKGLTLIETMMVLAVIGILATIAIPPAYQYYEDFQAREQVTEALHLLDNAKSPVTEFYVNNQRWPTPAEFDDIVTGRTGKYVASVSSQALDKGFQLTATFRNSGVSAELLHEGSGRKLVLATTDGVKWICNDSIDPDGGVPGLIPGNVLSQHRPVLCRQNG